MKTTKNYNLNKIEDDDFVDIVEHFNQNTEIIDVALGEKVDAEKGKTLSDNNFTDELKAKLEQASQKEHSHSNKGVLDKITQVLMNAWNSAVTHIRDTVKHITPEERNLWNTVSSKAEKEHTQAANTINVADVSAYFSGTNLEAVLSELGKNSLLPRGFIGEQTNWNSIIQTGIYQVGMTTPVDSENYPNNNGIKAYQWGILLVFSKESLILQTYYPHNKYDGMWFRVRYAATEDGWQEWTNVSSLAGRITVSDTAGNYISNNVENILSEIGTNKPNYWTGTQLQYNSLTVKSSNTLYLITG